MEKVKNELYPYWVWVTTMILAPFIFCALTTIAGLIQNRNFDSEIFYLWIWIVMLGSIFSIPTLIIYAMLFNKVSLYTIKTVWKKLLLSAVAITAMLLSFAFFNPDLYTKPTYKTFFLPICYCISILVAGLYFRMKIAKEKAVL